MILNCGVGEDSLTVPWTVRRSNQSILKEISPEYSLEGMKLKLQYFGHLMQRTDSLETTWCWERLKTGEGDNRGWAGWMASPTQRTWVWASSASWWWIRKPKLLFPSSKDKPCYSPVLVSVLPFSCLQTFPASGSFPNSQFSSGGQTIEVSASASVLPMNIQDWFLLGLTALISFQSKGISRVFSDTTVQKHQFFASGGRSIGASAYHQSFQRIFRTDLL